MKYLNVRKLRDILNDLIEEGMGDRAVAFPVCEYEEGWSGDYILVDRIKTNDVLESAVYLAPMDVNKNRETWAEIEEKAQEALDKWCESMIQQTYQMKKGTDKNETVNYLYCFECL